MSSPTPAARPFRLYTKLPNVEFHLRSFTGEEAVSKLFRFRLLADTEAHVPAARLLAQDVTFVMEPRPAQERRFLAMISSVEELGTDEFGRAVYSMELVPRLWVMTQTVQSRVFEGLKPLDIIRRVFEKSGSGIRPIAQKGREDRVRPYCVQYFESDFEFVVRLLEEEGYLYQYESNGDQPIFSIRYCPTSPMLGRIPYHAFTGGPQEERITSWKRTRVLTTTSVTARDHLFEANSPVLEGAATLPEPNPAIPGWESLGAKWSAPVDRYPGQWAHLFEAVLHDDETDLSGCVDYGATQSLHDLRQIASSTSASQGVSNCHRLTPGAVFALVEHPTSTGAHFLISVHHQGSQALAHSSHGGSEFSYENQFTAIPYAGRMIYLPPRTTRKPLIHGCQTAQVVGSELEKEILTDKYGRVKVEFWWDRGSRASCWVRVATSWAGAGWGVQQIPRVGQEVVVAFLNGDPDRPLIVGSVYNPSHMPPFSPAKNKTQSGIRTQSTPDGAAGESNEISFEDARGSEEIYIHAQKDRTAVVENDSGELVGNDRYDVVKNDFHATVKRDKRELVQGASSLKVEKDSMNEFLGNLGIKAGNIHLKAGAIVLEADSISIRTSDKGREFIHLAKGGGITIESKGSQVWVNCGGAGSPDDGCFNEPTKPVNPFEDGSD